MNTSTIVTLVVVIAIVVAAILLVRPMVRRRRLQQRFGPEYERAVASHDNRADAERDLMDRERRYSKFELRPLNPESRERYTREWADVQSRFVDAPERTVTDADMLVTELMAERGYPTEGDHEQRAADLSVEHASTLQHYRDAHEVHTRVGRGEASTEDLRQAMVHYRVIFVDLLDLDHDTREAATEGAAEPLHRTDDRTDVRDTRDARDVRGNGHLHDRTDDSPDDDRTGDRLSDRADGTDGRVDGRTDRHLDEPVVEANRDAGSHHPTR